jgi:HSP20 family protein
MNETCLNKLENRPATEARHNQRRHLTPAVNIYETKEAYVIEAEMPGVRKEDLAVTVEGNEVVIEGRRQADTGRAGLLYRESQDADFRRSFELHPEIDTTKIGARMNQGVLTLTLPKVELVKPRRVTVGD